MTSRCARRDVKGELAPENFLVCADRDCRGREYMRYAARTLYDLRAISAVAIGND